MSRLAVDEFGEYEVEECLDLVVPDEVEGFDYAYSVAARAGLTFVEDLSLVATPPVQQMTRKGARRGGNKKERLCADDIIASASHADLSVANELLEAADENMLGLIADMLLPPVGESIFDYGKRENNLRRRVIRCLGDQPGVQLGEVFVGGRGDQFHLLSEDGSVLVKGTAFEVLLYCVQYHRRDSAHVYRYLRENGKQPVKMSQFQHLLSHYRAERELSHTVNRFSKVSQLNYADYDHPYNWFCEVPVTDKVCGVNLNWRALVRFPNVVGEDDAEVVVADIVRGDHEGARSNDEALLERVLSMEDKEKYVHCVLDDAMCCHQGEIVYKPRPHNMTAVVWLGGDLPLSFFLHEVKRKIVSSNEWRNGRIFGWGEVRILEAWALDQALYDIFDCKTLPCSIRLYIEPRRKKGRRKRSLEDVQRELDLFFRDPNFTPIEVQVPKGQFFTVWGELTRMAVHGVPVLLQASLIYRQALIDGEVYFDGCWKVKRRNQDWRKAGHRPVSYTHLMLPTN